MPSFSISTKSLSSIHQSADSEMDEVYVGSTILRFLCLQNVDYREIENFLMYYPESLRVNKEEYLLEEILKKQMLECKCFGSSCYGNRKGILDVLRRGFPYYNSIRRVNPYNSIFMDSVVLGERKKFAFQLQTVGRDLRSISTRMTEVERQIEEGSSDVNNMRHQLEGVSKFKESNRPPLSLLQCKKVKVDNSVEKRVSLEKSFAVATLRISSLEQERNLLTVEQEVGVKLEQAIVTKICAQYRRHICNVSLNYPSGGNARLSSP
mmetsp:Transcript_45219/g.110149  ORF Transcript_45219/g.110149 Transcript_45219/m.110149 type:complete len:265 (+) Transcript_45219:2726-3520(+)